MYLSNQTKNNPKNNGAMLGVALDSSRFGPSYRNLRFVAHPTTRTSGIRGASRQQPITEMTRVEAQFYQLSGLAPC